MILIKSKRKQKYGIWTILKIVIVSIFLFLAVKSAWQAFQVYNSSLKELKQNETNLAKIESRKEDISHRLNELASPLGIEKELRRRFPVSREGEKMVVLYTKPTDEIETVEEKKDFWQGMVEKINSWLD